MKILIINRTSKPYGFGGLKRHAHLQSLLKKRGIDVQLLISNIDHTTNKRYGAKQNDEIKVVNLFFSGNSILCRALSIIEFSIKLHFKKLDSFEYIIGSSPDLISAFSAYLLSLRMGCPFIFEVRDIWPLSISELTNIKFGLSFLKLIESYLYKRSKLIISTIPDLKQYFLDNNFQEQVKKIFTLPQILMTKELPETAIRKTDNKNLKIVYCGSIRQNNNLPDILEYLDFTSKKFGVFFDFTVIGEGSSKEHIKNISKNLAFQTYFKDQLNSSQDIIKELSQYDVGVAYIKDAAIYKYGLSMNKSVDFLCSHTPLAIIGGKGINSFYDFDRKFKLSYNRNSFADFFYNFHKYDEVKKENISKDMKQFMIKKDQSKVINNLIQQLIKIGKI